jgi:hypothetical protein
MNETLRPWGIATIRGGYLIEGPAGASERVVRGAGGVREKADAELIVRAVNAHDDLVDACEAALTELERLTGDQGFEPERFAERLGALWSLAHALAEAKAAQS